MVVDDEAAFQQRLSNARREYRNERYTKAIEILEPDVKNIELKLQSDPETVKLFYNLLACCYIETSQLENGRELAERALKIDASQEWDISLLTCCVAANMAENKFDLALYDINRLLLLNPVVPLWRKMKSNRSSIYLSAGLAKSALFDVSSLWSETSCPHNAHFYPGPVLCLAQAYQQLDERTKAIKVYGQLLTLSNDPKLIKQSILALVKLAIPIDSSHSTNSSVKELKEDEMLVQLEKEAVSRGAYRVADLIRRAEIYLKFGWLRSALQDIQSAAALEPKNEDVLLVKARILDQLGQKQESAEIYRHILRSKEEHVAQAQRLLDECRQKLSLTNSPAAEPAK